ncbi:hypothetical protein OAM67_01535, partial [bacterium]|nr:hypothetical protein [bacterium]
ADVEADYSAPVKPKGFRASMVSGHNRQVDSARRADYGASLLVPGARQRDQRMLKNRQALIQESVKLKKRDPTTIENEILGLNPNSVNDLYDFHFDLTFLHNKQLQRSHQKLRLPLLKKKGAHPPRVAFKKGQKPEIVCKSGYLPRLVHTDAETALCEKAQDVQKEHDTMLARNTAIDTLIRKMYSELQAHQKEVARRIHKYTEQDGTANFTLRGITKISRLVAQLDAQVDMYVAIAKNCEEEHITHIKERSELLQCMNRPALVKKLTHHYFVVDDVYRQIRRVLDRQSAKRRMAPHQDLRQLSLEVEMLKQNWHMFTHKFNKYFLSGKLTQFGIRMINVAIAFAVDSTLTVATAGAYKIVMEVLRLIFTMLCERSLNMMINAFLVSFIRNLIKDPKASRRWKQAMDKFRRSKLRWVSMMGSIGQSMIKVTANEHTPVFDIFNLFMGEVGKKDLYKQYATITDEKEWQKLATGLSAAQKEKLAKLNIVSAKRQVLAAHKLSMMEDRSRQISKMICKTVGQVMFGSVNPMSWVINFARDFIVFVCEAADNKKNLSISANFQDQMWSLIASTPRPLWVDPRKVPHLRAQFASEKGVVHKYSAQEAADLMRMKGKYEYLNQKRKDLAWKRAQMHRDHKAKYVQLKKDRVALLEYREKFRADIARAIHRQRPWYIQPHSYEKKAGVSMEFIYQFKDMDYTSHSGVGHRYKFSDAQKEEMKRYLDTKSYRDAVRAEFLIERGYYTNKMQLEDLKLAHQRNVVMQKKLLNKPQRVQELMANLKKEHKKRNAQLDQQVAEARQRDTAQQTAQLDKEVAMAQEVVGSDDDVKLVDYAEPAPFKPQDLQGENSSPKLKEKTSVDRAWNKKHAKAPRLGKRLLEINALGGGAKSTNIVTHALIGGKLVVQRPYFARDLERCLAADVQLSGGVHPSLDVADGANVADVADVRTTKKRVRLQPPKRAQSQTPKRRSKSIYDTDQDELFLLTIFQPKDVVEARAQLLERVNSTVEQVANKKIGVDDRHADTEDEENLTDEERAVIDTDDEDDDEEHEDDHRMAIDAAEAPAKIRDRHWALKHLQRIRKRARDNARLERSNAQLRNYYLNRLRAAKQVEKSIKNDVLYQSKLRARKAQAALSAMSFSGPAVFYPEDNADAIGKLLDFFGRGANASQAAQTLEDDIHKSDTGHNVTSMLRNALVPQTTSAVSQARAEEQGAEAAKAAAKSAQVGVSVALGLLGAIVAASSAWRESSPAGQVKFAEDKELGALYANLGAFVDSKEGRRIAKLVDAKIVSDDNAFSQVPMIMTVEKQGEWT